MTTTATPAFTGTWTADREHSTVQAGVRHMGVGSFRTTFDDVTARLSAQADGTLALEGRAQVASIAIRTPAEFRALKEQWLVVMNATERRSTPHSATRCRRSVLITAASPASQA